jgi:hypothetical protein
MGYSLFPIPYSVFRIPYFPISLFPYFPISLLPRLPRLPYFPTSLVLIRRDIGATRWRVSSGIVG